MMKLPLNSILVAAWFAGLTFPIISEAEPQSGDVFREYVWLQKMYVIKYPGWKEHLDSQPFQPALDLPEPLDLSSAVKAELVLEIGNTHLGWEDMFFRINGQERIKIQFPAASPREPSPSRWFNYWSPVIPVPLKDLDARTNQVQFMVGPLTYDGRNPHEAWEPLYTVVLRVYYDPAGVSHPKGEIVSPGSDSKIGLKAELRVRPEPVPGHDTVSIDFVGHYEDVNYEGDGLCENWHYQIHQGKMRYHLGTTPGGEAVDWDTSWVPDQTKPMVIVAWLRDASGLVCVTKPATGLVLDRPGLSVELARPYDVPMAFTSCQYGSYIGKGPQTAKFNIKGDLSHAIDARFAIAAFNGKEAQGLMVNGTTLEKTELPNAGFPHQLFVVPLLPLSALTAGTNTFTLLPGKGRSSDVALPGPAVLVRYKK